MKKIIFFMGLSMFFLISCSTNKNLGNNNNRVEDSENYFKSSFALNPNLAKEEIGYFPKHIHRVTGKKIINGERATFDTELMAKILTDPNVDSIKFFLARSQVKDSTYKYPTIVLQVKLKSSFIKGKGSTNEEGYFLFAQYQYIGAKAMCPPPNDCMVEN